MSRNFLVAVLVVLAMSLAASAGTINGKVSGVSGESVVYVDVIQGKTFPAPCGAPVDRSEGADVHASHRGGRNGRVNHLFVIVVIRDDPPGSAHGKVPSSEKCRCWTASARSKPGCNHELHL